MFKRSLKIWTLSDLHGELIEPPKQEFDVVIIAGDICPDFDKDLSQNAFYQLRWINTAFRMWCKSIEKPIIVTWGNHDSVGAFLPDDINFADNVTLLLDSGTSFRGINIWGTPRTPRYGTFCFTAEDQELTRYWDLIPDDTQLLICHGPFWGVNDTVSRYNRVTGLDYLTNDGSKTLLTRVNQLKLHLFICGHLHNINNKKHISHSGTSCVNVAIRDDDYNIVNRGYILSYKYEK
jgi:predicted phosphodiesterase